MAAYALTFVFPAAFALLPGVMDTPEARSLLIAIGLQETEFRERIQVPNGPARSFWQMEKHGGCEEVLTSPRTKVYALTALSELRYKPNLDRVFDALADNDVLACVWARLLLWNYPTMPPPRSLPQKGWRFYLQAWRPGRPYPDLWNARFARAWSMVQP